jgi:GNAT superfamily N-acetyltransferase
MSRHPTTVTHLAMHAPFGFSTEPVVWPAGLSFLPVENIALDDYRRLYDSVGRDWHWVNRRHLTDRQLASLIHHPACHIRVLYRGNKPIGFVELNSRKLPEVEIVFVGLVSVEIGLGLGQLMVRAALTEIAALKAERIIIQTCTLDHPNALPLYQRFGFQAYDRKQVVIIDD